MAAASEIDDLRKALPSEDPFEQNQALDSAYRLKEAAAPLVPDLLALFFSDRYVECFRLETQASGHDVIAARACSVLSGLAVPVDLDAVRRVLRDENVYALPETSCDKGAYIGDYGCEMIAPAAFAARLADAIGPAGFDLVPDLAVDAVLEEETIGKAARVALLGMSKRLDRATLAQRELFRRAMQLIGGNPDAVPPATTRGFDMRDLAAIGLRGVAKLA